VHHNGFGRAIEDEMERRSEIGGIVQWPLPNVWLGVSVEDQKRANLRIPALLDTPAAVRFLSCEPLLGPVNLSAWLDTPPSCGCGVAPDGAPGASGCSAECMAPEPSGLGWCIVGGESGPGARPMHPQWVRSLRDQCTAAGVPYFLKQWGEWAPEDVLATRHGAANALYIEQDGSTRPAARGARGEAVTVQRNGKKATGRKIDGREWSEYPAVTA
jgi:protein gp37